MRRISASSALLLLMVATQLGARPTIAPKGVVNAASFRPVGVPGSAIAPGALFSIFGIDLGPASPVSASSFPLQPSLASVSIRVTAGDGVVLEALPIYVSAGQLNGILPSTTTLGSASFTVTYQNQTSDPVRAEVVGTSLGLITLSASGSGQVVAQNFVSEAVSPLNSPTNPAQPGQVVIVFGTGLGPVDVPDNMPPPVADMNVPLEILVGGRPARRLYAGRSPCCAGLDQVNFQIPVDAPAGCYVPITIKAGDLYSNYGSIAIGSAGSPCSDPVNPLAGVLASREFKSVAAVSLTRNLLQLNVSGQSLDSTLDTASAFFLRAGETFFAFPFSLPALGSCSVLTFRSVAPQPPPGLLLPASNLQDAGPQLRITGPGGPKTATKELAGTYFGGLGGGANLPGLPQPPALYLVQGRYTAAGPGGSDIGSWMIDLDLPDASTWVLTWTSRDQMASIDRTQPLHVTWSGGNADRGIALLSGSSTDASLGVGASFVCVAPLAPGSFNIPVSVLSELPASTVDSGTPSGTLVVGSSTLPAGARFTARGLDLGVFYYSSTVSRVVSYR